MAKNREDVINIITLIGFALEEEYENAFNQKVIYYTFENINFIIQGDCTMMHDKNEYKFYFHYDNDYNSTYKELCKIYKVDIRKNKIEKLINKNFY